MILRYMALMHETPYACCSECAWLPPEILARVRELLSENKATKASFLGTSCSCSNNGEGSFLFLFRLLLKVSGRERGKVVSPVLVKKKKARVIQIPFNNQTGPPSLSLSLSLSLSKFSLQVSISS
ncbi:hypothetical protein L1887_00656 [Cichorium endivia]|nr:hypothetical protein L1887_00656 [Cichorium endivia]